MWLCIAANYFSKLQHYFILKITLIFYGEIHETFHMTENRDNHKQNLTNVKLDLAIKKKRSYYKKRREINLLALIIFSFLVLKATEP